MELPKEENVWDSIFEEKHSNGAVRDERPNLPNQSVAQKEVVTPLPQLEVKLDTWQESDDYIAKVKACVEKFETAGFFKDLDEAKKGTMTKEMICKLADEVIAKHKDRILRIRDPNYDAWSNPQQTPMINKFNEIKEGWKREESNHRSTGSENSSMNVQNVKFAWSSNVSRQETSEPRKSQELHSTKVSTNDVLHGIAAKNAHELKRQHLMRENEQKNSSQASQPQTETEGKAVFKMDPLEKFVVSVLPKEKKKRPKEKHKSLFWFWGSKSHNDSPKKSKDRLRSPDIEDYKIDVVSEDSSPPNLHIPFAGSDATETSEPTSPNPTSHNEEYHPSLIDIDDEEEHKKCSVPSLMSK
ncbi:unnamed protein product [Kluyveromyces dobzhanskii CBS 2104]|uniref:WGS project CCBQ000000000 data, contig 00041 n=1 Tax=Kluyveromyces dobzhanskii CBS 2104 TaxID=1427455 RepID=A0A0A8L0G6_9SACH|nr:unnamed protein product [Kluyveromyces dobzhanskii CBS 2104]